MRPPKGTGRAGREAFRGTHVRAADLWHLAVRMRDFVRDGRKTARELEVARLHAAAGLGVFVFRGCAGRGACRDCRATDAAGRDARRVRRHGRFMAVPGRRGALYGLTRAS